LNESFSSCWLELWSDLHLRIKVRRVEIVFASDADKGKEGGEHM
jgi:hypothetical protein